VNSVGGIGGGGVWVTPFGDLLVETYRRVEGQIAALGLKSLKEIKAHARDDVSEARHRVSIVKKRPRKK
jgi:molybdenum-dependent DNA-binding transcriptional regulator ModE